MHEYYSTGRTRELTKDSEKHHQQVQQQQQQVPVHHHQSNQLHSIYNREGNGIRNKPNKLKISYSVGDTTSDKHCFGVNSLSYDYDSNLLYSAGRDSSVKSWSIRYAENSLTRRPLETASYLKSYDEHTDWVNDIFVDGRNGLLVSCSSDTTIKVWNTRWSETDDESSPLVLKNITKHDDYVKVLAYAPRMNYFASSGLDSHIMLWDLNKCCKTTTLVNEQQQQQIFETSVTSNKVDEEISLKSSSDDFTTSGNGINIIKPTIGGQQQQPPQAPTESFSPMFKNSMLLGKAGGEGISIYSLAITKDASMVYSGSTEKVVRAWDVKSGQKTFKLKGHSENIRAILIDDDNRRCLTASSDGTVRLWDIGQASCIHVFEDIHNDSVWSIAANSSFTEFYSGSRDGEIYKNSLTTLKSTFITKDDSSILKILNNEEHDRSIWYSTSQSDIKNFSIVDNEKREEEEEKEEKEKESVLIRSPLLQSNKSTTDNKEEMFRMKENFSIQGRPGIIKYHVLNNRIHILTKDTNDQVELWDIIRGCKLESFHKINFEEKIEEFNEKNQLSISKWFTVDTKTGSIYITLESPQCYQADCYIANIGLKAFDSNVIFNIGELIITSIFSNYLIERKKQKQQQAQNQNEKPQSQQNQQLTYPNNPLLQNFELLPKSTQILIFENLSSVKLRCKISDFRIGYEEFIPNWVHDVLFSENYHNPQNSSGSQNQGYLKFQIKKNGIHQVKLVKVSITPIRSPESNSIEPLVDYNVTLNQNLPIVVLLKQILDQYKVKMNEKLSPPDYLEILFNSKQVPNHFTLATIKSYIIKDKDFVLQYRFKLPVSPNQQNSQTPSNEKKINLAIDDQNQNNYQQKNNHSSMVYNVNK